MPHGLSLQPSFLQRRLTVGAVAHAPRPFLAASFQRRRLTVGAVAHAPRPSICELATAPRKTSEMLELLKHMGVTAYKPRQRGNLQNPRPLPLTFSAEEK